MPRVLPDMNQFIFQITVGNPLRIMRESLLKKDILLFERAMSQGKADPNEYTFKLLNLVEHAYLHLPVPMANQFILVAFKYGLNENTVVSPLHYFEKIPNHRFSEFHVGEYMAAKQKFSFFKCTMKDEIQRSVLSYQNTPP